MCENLVRIGWNRRYVNFQGWGRSPLLGGLHLTCDAYFHTWPSYSSQKLCVNIWFGLVEPFRSYRGNIKKKKKKKKKKITDVTENNMRPFGHIMIIIEIMIIMLLVTQTSLFQDWKVERLETNKRWYLSMPSWKKKHFPWFDSRRLFQF